MDRVINKHPLAWWTENGPRQDRNSWAFHEARKQEQRKEDTKWQRTMLSETKKCSSD